MARLFDDGSSEYLQISSAVIAGPPYTLAGWFKSDDAGASGVILGLADKDSGSGRLALIARGTAGGDPLSFFRNGFHLETSSGFTANTWHHACGVSVAADDWAVYIDGGSKSTEAVTRTTATFDVTSVGRHSDSTPGNYFSGSVAEVGIWNVALADAEVAILAAGFSPLFVRPQNLVAYWSLIRDEDQDRVGGYDLTAYNTPSVTAHPPIIYPAPPLLFTAPSGAAPVTIPVNVITLTGSAASSAVSPGGVAVVFAASTLASLPGGLLVSPGEAKVILDALLLANDVGALTISQGAVSVLATVLTVAGAAQSLTVSPGGVATPFNALSLSGSAEALNISSAVSILLSALAASGSVNTIDIVPGAVSVLLDALGVIGSAENIAVLLGATTIALATLGLASSSEVLTVSPGAVTTALTALSLASGVGSLEILSSVNVLLAAMSAAASAESLTIVPGGISVLLAALNLTGSPEAVTVISGAMIVALAALSLAGSAESSAIVPGAVAVIIDALTLACGAGGLVVSPGAVVTLLSALSILSQTESLSIRLGSLVYGDVDGLAVSQRSIGAISHDEVIGLIVNMIISGDI